MELDFWVRIGLWANARRVSLTNGFVQLEVARMACRHCPTCCARVDYVNSRVNGEGQWARVGNGLALLIPYPKGSDQTEVEVAEFLQKKLQLPVRLAA